MFLALSVFDNFLFEFDKISLLAVAAGSRGVAPSVLNVDSQELGGSHGWSCFSTVPGPTANPKSTFQESQSNRPKTDPKIWLSRISAQQTVLACNSLHLGLYLERGKPTAIENTRL